MGRTNHLLPVYTGDVSGACSALYELGGMVVIHDPSGCNSTYNTHDETRWYDQDSLIFITGLTERDAVLGNDEKLVRDVVDAALELRPRFVALCNSPIPWISGTDFAALCRLIERQTGIPCLYVRTNGMHDYVVGAGNALAEIARRFVVSTNGVCAGSANLLGVTPLDFHQADAVQRLRDFVEGAGFSVSSCWAMGSSLDELTRAGEASVNVVVSAAGLAAAKVLRERFGTPYVVGTPFVGYADLSGFLPELERSMREAVASGACLYPCRDARSRCDDGSCCVIADPVAAGSLAAAREAAGLGSTRVICATEAARELLAESDVTVDGEEQVRAALAQATTVFADPSFKPALAKDAELVPLPHLAFSGRAALSE